MHDPVCLIGGEAVATHQTLPVIDPSTGEETGAIARGSAGEIDQAVEAARAALRGSWGRLDATQRGGLLHRFSVLIRENAERLAEAVVAVLDEGIDGLLKRARQIVVLEQDAATCPRTLIQSGPESFVLIRRLAQMEQPAAVAAWEAFKLPPICRRWKWSKSGKKVLAPPDESSYTPRSPAARCLEVPAADCIQTGHQRGSRSLKR